MWSVSVLVGRAAAATTGLSDLSGRGAAFFVDGVLWIRQIFRWFDENVIDRFVNWVAKVVTWISGWSGKVDYEGVDGGVRGVSELVLWGGARVRQMQTGKLQEYLVGSVIVLGALLIVIIVWSH